MFVPDRQTDGVTESVPVTIMPREEAQIRKKLRMALCALKHTRALFFFIIIIITHFSNFLFYKTPVARCRNKSFFCKSKVRLALKFQVKVA